MCNENSNKDYRRWLRSFASLNWYEEAVKFIFSFVSKTSELLLAAGIVVSTANFLTDGDVMSHNKVLSDAWSWAQAIAIDSSLGIVFVNAFVAIREREKIKAIVFIMLTALLATVAGLITHFDALAHAAGLSVSDKSVSGIIPLWVMTALRSVAVIGFLLASRLKNVSFNELRRELAQQTQQDSAAVQEPPGESAIPPIDYDALVRALVTAMQQMETASSVRVEEERAALPEPSAGKCTQNPSRTSASFQGAGAEQQESGLETKSKRELVQQTTDEKLSAAFRAVQAEGSKVTGEALSRRAGVRKQTTLEWLRKRQEHETNSDVSFPAVQ